MAVPKQKSIDKRNRQKEFWKRTKEEKKKEKITPEEHEERLKKLRELGILK